ncbi:MAG: RecX family transcriptional regulator [Bacteroidia bacterium]|nr:RecX family transcriptional regulator [Bacteroidia bacterium]
MTWENTSKSQKKDYEQAWTAIQKFCAYQERCHQEVRNRLYDYGLKRDEVEELIFRLIENNFLNEERFAIAYAGGKFRVKRWGRNKILTELKRRKISDYCIRKGMSEIDDEQYVNTLKEIVEQKARTYKAANQYILNKKIATYCYNRGYESELIWDILRARMNE